MSSIIVIQFLDFWTAEKGEAAGVPALPRREPSRFEWSSGFRRSEPCSGNTAQARSSRWRGAACSHCGAGTCAAFGYLVNSAVLTRPAFHRSAATKVLSVHSKNSPAALLRNSVRFLVLAVCGLVLLAHSARAQDRVLTLSIVNFNFLLNPPFQTIQDTLPIMASLSIRPEQSSMAARPVFQEGASFATTLFLETTFQPEAVNVFSLARQNGRAAFGIWDLVQAGYGQTFYDRMVPAYAQHGAGQEEPTYGYLKISFRF